MSFPFRNRVIGRLARHCLINADVLKLHQLDRTELVELAMATTAAAARFLPFLEPEEESALLAAATPKSFDRNQVVIDQNVPMRAIYLIEDGSVHIEQHDRERTTPLAILAAGEFFGEMSFVDGAPTSARMVAEEPSRLRIIDAATVEDMVKTDPRFAARFYHSIAAILAERLRLTSMRIYLDQSWG
jgi:CRP-like cAMP-binding protein